MGRITAEKTNSQIQEHVYRITALNRLLNKIANEMRLTKEEKEKLNTALILQFIVDGKNFIEVIPGELIYTESSTACILYLPTQEGNLKYEGYTSDVEDTTTTLLLRPQFTVGDEEYSFGDFENTLLLMVNESHKVAFVSTADEKVFVGVALSISNYGNSALFIESGQEEVMKTIDLITQQPANL